MENRKGMCIENKSCVSSSGEMSPVGMGERSGRLCRFAFRWMACVLMLVNASTLMAESHESEDERAGQRLFALKVLPVFGEKCFGCHGADVEKRRGEFDMRTLQGLLDGGETGEPAIVPGDPDGSVLVQSIEWQSNEMPPKENDRLSQTQIDAVREWIRLGAAWPDEETQTAIRLEEATREVTDDGVLVTTSGGTSEQWTLRRYDVDDLWALKPVRSETELVGEAAIDSLINRRLDEAGFAAAPRATPVELIRRATFDLTGLPPSPEEIDQFVAASERDPKAAWEELVDRLLASPQYGERAAQHWFDVTRYADTGGMANDYERSNMWRYRDYVIRSFNNDKPYDQFIVEQIAGDELADESVRARLIKSLGEDVDADKLEKQVHQVRLDGDYTAEEAEAIVATGYLRMGHWDNAMVEKEEARQIFLDDIVNNVGQTFLATTLRCVKCHDHKFDPIPTRDYYRIYSAFSATQMAERPVPFLPSENRNGFKEGKRHVERMLAYATTKKNELVSKQEAAARKWFEEHNLPYKNEDERKELPDEMKPPRHVGLNHIEQGRLKVRNQDEWIWTRRLERYQPMAQSVFNSSDVGVNIGARKLRLKEKINLNQPTESFILTGGAITAPADPVGPGVLSMTGVGVRRGEVESNDLGDEYRLTDNINGRRFGLARWIADARNPLTSRAIVNRIWQSHFGVGIAANANNFGAKGAKPTHPELLDFLASDFLNGGWKIKRMHRMIMLSDAYQRSSYHPNHETLRDADPDNTTLAYFPIRRMTAEELRDAMLAMTGELNLEAGGLPISSEINMEVALQPRMIQFSLAPAYQPSRLPEQRNRRSIYAYRVRGQADPMLELFNQPNPNESCERRDVAAVTPQALTLLNSDVMTDRSIAMAKRLQEIEPETHGQIEAAFRILLGRSPRPHESDRLGEYVADMQTYHADVDPEPTEYPTEITRSLVEEFTGRPFEYTEILPVFERYVPDAKPADVSPETRALADLCLLLFNTNEFLYIR
ncbi:PSD1 and planctomycete cytochrome C domain-containing protein [Aporhodopirellula aestuarii]|uniref:PSD1 and planctomycete cytochrome C domain-containing protein n=1 Tax=Aporhodopirellula aestuarii TaxID=2950107 RepID=A0ABT0U8A0_9BACT|nr:PSD1 and planctomycete cytochrome C domain-containing protein [Aporhodopirellula aestuarii]MCM2373011.1 PSD1 and planctomycete cytochrome C domain-containing protein [Aporhodopirellula aestuarii]